MSTPSAPDGPSFAAPQFAASKFEAPPSQAPQFQAPHAAPPVGTLLAPPPSNRRGKPLGIWALVMALVAGVLASAVAGFVSFRIARGAGPALLSATPDTIDLRVLSPVRDLVLAGEIAFWVATVIGVAAVVTGIVATVRGAGRGAGIAAIVIGALGPVVFALFVAVALVGGVATLPGGGGVSV